MFGILSAPYLISVLFSEQTDWKRFFILFFVIHALLFGGATAYNSYWDKDEGPVGGLKNPPKMEKWMQTASLLLMGSGLWFSLKVSNFFTVLYMISFFLFWAYSSPVLRWKGRPFLSLFTIGISTGSNSFLMGVLALGNEIEMEHWITSVGVACMLTAMYPVSQLFQMEEDSKRGDITFTIRYGKKGILWLFLGLNSLGTLFVSYGLSRFSMILAFLFPVISAIPTVIVYQRLNHLKGEMSEYDKVMTLKYVMSFSFVLLSLGVILIKYFKII